MIVNLATLLDANYIVNLVLIISADFKLPPIGRLGLHVSISENSAINNNAKPSILLIKKILTISSRLR